MKHRFTLAVTLALIAAAGLAQDSEEGRSLMERGMELFLDGLREEMSPAMEDLRKLAEDYGPAMFSFLEEMGPAFGELMEQVKDWTAYEAPEILPNGDIIMRRKPDADPMPAPALPDPPPAGQTDI